jgi:hypothetical protein
VLGVTDWDDGGYGIGPGDVRRYVEHELLGIPRPPVPSGPTTELLVLFVKYAELLCMARLHPAVESAQKAVDDFQRKHMLELTPYWHAWYSAGK